MMAGFNVPAYNPTPIQSPQNALMQGLEMQRAQQGNALQQYQLQALMQRAQQEQAAQAQQAAREQQRQTYLGSVSGQAGPPAEFNPLQAFAAGFKPDEIKALLPQPKKRYSLSPGGKLVEEDGQVIAQADFKPEPQKLPPIGELQAYADTLPPGPKKQQVQGQINNMARAPKYATGGGSGGGGPAAAPTPKPMTALQEAKRRDQIAKDYAGANTVISNMADVLDSVESVKTAKGLSGATGLQAYVPSMPGGAAATAEVRLQNLEGKITNLGKAAAAASGAVGPMAVQEWKIVRDMVAAIDPKKGEGPLREQIALVEAATKGAVSRLRDAYEKHYAEDFERFPQFSTLAEDRKSSAPAKIGSDAEYNALPSGSTFVGPDGKTRRKP